MERPMAQLLIHPHYAVIHHQAVPGQPIFVTYPM